MSTEVRTLPVFSFEAETDAAAPAPSGEAAVAAHAQVIDAEALQHIRRAVEAAEEATYHWIIETDEIQWSSNIEAVLHCKPDQVPTGRAYANLLDGESTASRYETIMLDQSSDNGSGVSFQIECFFKPEGRASRRGFWLEDKGKWFSGKNGRPAEAYGAIRRIDDRHNREEHLSFLGSYDPLTGMMSRGRLTEALGETIVNAYREQQDCAFLIAAVNNLAVVNEAYGYEVADEVIAAMGKRLRQMVRAGDAIARYSGSKFGIILADCNGDELEVAIERFVNIARESVIETEHGPVWAMLSIGAVVVPTNAHNATIALARAEEALTEARRLPSDGSVIYQPSSKRLAERGWNAKSAAEIVRSLKDDQFKLGFQPIVDSRTREIVFHEALLRMTDDENRMITAAHLIPVAEKLGLVRLIDRAVAQKAIAALHRHPQACLSINVSGLTATDPRWFNQLIAIISANQSVAERLVIEITETIALGNIKETLGFVEALRNIGCSVAIDDFGAGFTSFRNLRDLPVNIVKLDGSFCRNLKENSANQYLVQTLTDLGHKFGLKVIAEWVETREDADILTKCRVDCLQGYHFGVPSFTLPWPETGQPNFTNFIVPESQRVKLEGPEDALQLELADAKGQLMATLDTSAQDANEDLGEELSRLRLAIQSLDKHFRE